MRMLYLLLSTILLSACSSTPKNEFGTYIIPDYQSETIVSVLAADAADQIEELYVPAQTKFFFVHQTNDQFGLEIKEQLRVMGYAISEYDVSSSGDGERVAYIVDHYSDTALLVRLYVGDNTLSRLYQLDQNMAFASGAWSRME